MTTTKARPKKPKAPELPWVVLVIDRSDLGKPIRLLARRRINYADFDDQEEFEDELSWAGEMLTDDPSCCLRLKSEKAAAAAAKENKMHGFLLIPTKLGMKGEAL